MLVLPFRSPWLLVAAGLLFASGAVAQSVMPVAPMPPPPSAKDPLPRSTSEPARPKPARKAARPAPEAPEDAEPKARRPARAQTGARDPSIGDRIDTRPARQDPRGALQLDDDPRAVAPVMQNGRPGVGMRF